MRYDDKTYKMFLEEIQELENFRLTYAAGHPSTPLDSDDPDVRRLIEAMAFFSARTHTAGLRNIASSRHRIFKQLFPFLLSPIPAMGVFQVKPTGQFVESTLLPKGAEIALSSETKGAVIFKSLCDLNILPVTVTGMDMTVIPGKGTRAFLKIRAPFPLNEEIGQLRFHINHLNDYHASMRIFYFLRKYLKRAGVVFEDKIDGTSLGKSCNVSFGTSYDETETQQSHPLQKERQFFHFPQEELFVNVDIPRPPRDWDQFILVFDLGTDWPKELRLNKELFQLFAVPVINLHQSEGQPFICDGTKEKYLIRHSDAESGFEFHSAVGVYRVEQEGMEPVKPGIIYGENESYEIEQEPGSGNGSKYFLNLHFPETFNTPKTFLIDALWIQPGLSGIINEILTVEPYSRKIAGVKWGMLGELMPHFVSDFQDDMEEFMHLLTIKNKSILNFDDVTTILKIVGNVHHGSFKGVLALLSDIKVEESSHHKSSAGMLKLIYILIFKNVSPAILPLIDTFTEHVGSLLDAWISGAKVEATSELIQLQE